MQRCRNQNGCQFITSFFDDVRKLFILSGLENSSKNNIYFHLAGERSFSYDEFRMTLDSELYYYRKNNLDEIECLEKRISLFEFVYFFNRIRLKNQINLNFYKAVHECKRRIDEIKKR